MVNRIELVLIVAILLLVIIGAMTNVSHLNVQNNNRLKSMEIVSAYFTEANSSARVSNIYVSKLIRYPDEMQMYDFRLTTDDVVLSTSKAIQRDNHVLLDQNSTLIRSNGSLYHISNAVYDKASKVLKVYGNFSLKNRFGNINGTGMRYNLYNNSVDAKSVKAIYKTNSEY